MCIRTSFCLALAALTLSCGLAAAQNKIEKRTLVLNGRSGEITVFMVDGVPFVNLRTLVEIGSGNVAFSGSTIILTFASTPAIPQTALAAPALPASVPTPQPPPEQPPSEQPQSNALSGEFMRVAIQELAVLKEWHAYMAYGITKGVPGDGSRMVLNQNQATEGLRLAQAAASTDADRNAFELLRADFENVNQWYRTLVEGRKKMSTANYSMSEDPLKDDSLYQKIVACSDFLGMMIPSGTFSDHPACR